MKFILTITSLIILHTNSVFADVCENAFTKFEMNTCLTVKYNNTYQEMNKMVEKVIAKSPEKKKDVLRSQELFIELNALDCKLKKFEGSLNSIEQNSCIINGLNNRTLFLSKIHCHPMLAEENCDPIK